MCASHWMGHTKPYRRLACKKFKNITILQTSSAFWDGMSFWTASLSDPSGAWCEWSDLSGSRDQWSIRSHYGVQDYQMGGEHLHRTPNRTASVRGLAQASWRPISAIPLIFGVINQFQDSISSLRREFLRFRVRFMKKFNVPASMPTFCSKTPYLTPSVKMF